MFNLLIRFSILLTTVIMACAPVLAADLPGTVFVEERDDDDEWTVELFGSVFFLLNDFGAAAAPGGGVIAEDRPVFFGNPQPSTQSASLADASSSPGTLIELGGNIYRNQWGVGASVLFSTGSGGGGSAGFGYEPLSHGGTPGVLGSGPTPTLIDAINPALLFSPPLESGPINQFLSVPGGVKVSAEASIFRSYEANLIYRQNPGCDEGAADCACPDDENILCESRWKIHIGPRYFEFGEEFSLELEAFSRSFLGGISANTYTYYGMSLTGQNEIYGLQIGGEYKLLKNYMDRIDLSLAGRLGYGMNKYSAGAEGVAIERGSAGNPLNPIGGIVEGKTGTLFGQLDVGLGVDLTNNIELSAGYRGIWIEKVADIGSQFPNLSVSTTSGGGEIDLQDLLLHMGRIGLQLRF